jgi:hypothetical protein
MYPWPITDGDVVLDEALYIAMRYLEQAGFDEDYTNVERMAAKAILDSWRMGVRHPIYLANKAIVAVERGERLGSVHTLHPRVG